MTCCLNDKVQCVQYCDICQCLRWHLYIVSAIHTCAAQQRRVLQIQTCILQKQQQIPNERSFFLYLIIWFQSRNTQSSTTCLTLFKHVFSVHSSYKISCVCMRAVFLNFSMIQWLKEQFLILFPNTYVYLERSCFEWLKTHLVTLSTLQINQFVLHYLWNFMVLDKFKSLETFLFKFHNIACLLI